MGNHWNPSSFCLQRQELFFCRTLLVIYFGDRLEVSKIDNIDSTQSVMSYICDKEHQFPIPGTFPIKGDRSEGVSSVFTSPGRCSSNPQGPLHGKGGVPPSTAALPATAQVEFRGILAAAAFSRSIYASATRGEETPGLVLLNHSCLGTSCILSACTCWRVGGCRRN